MIGRGKSSVNHSQYGRGGGIAQKASVNLDDLRQHDTEKRNGAFKEKKAVKKVQEVK